ncbi:hypothetical protein TrVE_jg6418 [Triparma verrucosa]|uniref:Spindle assembly abnormal protein 6 N-terminal domain-containing protein n=2 Tax=Triparma TaxID=722752 RepID=A0A9W7ESE1_9STRA|nr:hypothetical protein TrST_g13425 [Triparma strigata]GMI08789.1 hypothetical protein TrVE_jg6418 [Triparma verrucosa]|mmetsp:Transcript_10966/g.19841  ORF Transcript_10966/g.19841 Transcript_10966/m.19841 type:complete len:221 (+) Transcript_10966:170-832(+)|eukprot:CAMPEP_0182499644 /NCGR_PEP_ID=MMETSP1321-20130603/7876_1 /TAXON_ID=91990 /ORGANISM="Bolidomonas sp., Strain RCC1657" /LENGTH=220 /DNA_ID=CAMNT_0024703877 /DNA_START=133 /DNA_END=795 /DNA_ORIENTATION=-
MADFELNTFDFASIEELDPSIADGYRVIYDREVPFELRLYEQNAPQQVGTLEAVKAKVLVLGDEHNLQSIRVELSSEADLFFHYMHVIDEAGFLAIQEQQKLMVEFADYPNVLIRMLNNCIKEPHSHLAVFVMKQDVDARLDFIQNMEYKFVELMSCHFIRSPEEIVQHQITYRYNAMKTRLSLMQGRLEDVNNLVKLKNPSLLLQLQKAPQGQMTGFNR